MKKTTPLLCVILSLAAVQVRAVNYKATILSNSSYDNTYGAAIDVGRIAGNCVNNNGNYTPSLEHPMLWANSQSSAQPISCGNYIGGSLTCMQGDTLGGSVSFVEREVSSPFPHKYLSPYASTWSASTGVRTDMHPTGYISSAISGCWGNQQVGYAKKEITSTTPPYTKTTYADAILWNGSADNYVNLRPWGYSSASALAIWENTQVGEGQVLPNSKHYALMWHGTGASVINLHPSSFYSSSANDVWGSQQVGAGSMDQNLPSPTVGTSHALLWTGSAASCIDLHPDGFYSSYAYAVCNGDQVGAGRVNSSSTNKWALLWTGSAQSVVNLHQFLSANYVSSYAYDIDEFGNIVGNALMADGSYDMVLWEPVPEPATLLLLGIGAMVLRRKK